MTQADPSQHQNGESGGQTAKGHAKRLQALLPKERKPKIVWFIVCSLVAIGTLVYAIVFNTKEMFHEDNDLCTKKMQSNISMETCYRRVEKKTYPVIVNIGLGLLGIILGHFIYCLCNIVEELRQFEQRYNRSISELCKQCMTGISWKSAIAVGIIDVIGVGFAKGFSFKLGDLLYISGGIGVSPLISYLLNLNLQTGVDRSRDLEKNGLHPSYTLAWHYYTHHIKKILPIFVKRFSTSSTPVQDQEGSSEHTDRDKQPKIQLSSKKLIVLLSHDYKKDVKLVDLDNNITEITCISEGGYKFPLYNLKHGGKDYQYVIQYADKPLETLQSMCTSEGCKAVHEDQLEEQVKLLCKTLSEILMKDGYYRNMCTFVLITEVESLQNGGPVKIIMSYVEKEKCASMARNYAPTQVQPQETDDALDAPYKSTIVDIDIENTEGSTVKLQNNTGGGYFIPADDQDVDPFFKEKDGKPKREKDLVNPKLQIIKNRGKKCNSSDQRERIRLVSPPDKNVKMMNNREQSSPIFSKEQATGMTEPPVSEKRSKQSKPTHNNAIPITLQPENRTLGGQFLDEVVKCPNEREDVEVFGAKFDLTDEKGRQATFSLGAGDSKETCHKKDIVEL